MSNQRNNKIWEEFMREAFGYHAANGMEGLAAFQARMEKSGFTLDWIKPAGGPGEMSDREFVEHVIAHLNLKAGTRFRAKVASANGRLIVARRREGFKAEHFHEVIDKKCHNWLGTKWEAGLTPETLFSAEKFENFLGQKTGNHGQAASTGYGQLDEQLRRAENL